MAGHLWGVHMDRTMGSQPIDGGFIAIGWAQLGDLSAIKSDRDTFKNVVRRTFPEAKQGSIPVQAGVLFRFLYEMKEGDTVVYPSKADRMVNIGVVSGPYSYDPNKNAEYPNQRPVTWLKHLPREDFSQAALYEIGSFITLFSVRKHADEFVAALEGRPISKQALQADDEGDDDSVTQAVSFQAEETTQDFVIRQLKTSIDAYQFERFVAHLLECMGYHARVTAKSGDGGVDVIAHKDELGFEPPIIKVQCKQVTNAIGRPEVAQLIGHVEHGEHALFVTLGPYTRDAKEYERSKANLRLIDGPQLVELIYDHYSEFEPRYQSLLPLKRIYVPSLHDAGL
ncbi:restriction endonuclease [Mesorhizobium sp. INR15]|nr:restriction endonuclease [Mesorhizobium sp. INR15]